MGTYRNEVQGADMHDFMQSLPPLSGWQTAHQVSWEKWPLIDKYNMKQQAPAFRLDESNMLHLSEYTDALPVQASGLDVRLLHLVGKLLR